MRNTISSALRAKLASDPFARHLGIELIEVAPGYAKVGMDIRPEFETIHEVTHGGAIFSLADAAFAVASNAGNRVSLALNMNITYHQGTRAGDRLTAEAREKHAGGRTATYLIEVRDQREALVATVQAVVYRKDKPVVET